MSRKILYLLSILAVIALTIAACAPQVATQPAKTEAPTAPTEPAKLETEAPAPSAAGKIQLAGSTTVQPLAELLAEAFMANNPDVAIEVQGGGSSVGVTSAGEGTVNIGMASRGIKDSEMQQFADLQVHTIAFDGIAVVTNPDLDIPTLSIEQVQSIFDGEVTNWSEVGGPSADIVVVSREEGSGTRAAFEELVMGEEKLITENALLQQSNGQVRTTVSTTPNSVGYLSFGFLDESIKGVPIDGVAPTVDNVKNGSYPIFRPLNMLTKGAPNEMSQAFLDFILGEEGQAIVSEDYISVTGGGEEAPIATEEPMAELSGQLQLAGSTTVQPLAEALGEVFMAKYPGVVIEVQGGGSSVGVTSAGECTVPIGNASRGIKDSEMQQFPQLQVHTIAFDGIAVVTNPDLDIPTLSIEQVQSIFDGEVTNWSEVGGPSADIVVVSREEGSGTRAAFEELVMGEEKLITENALLQQSNGQVRTTVSTTPNSVGYLSFGFLDESIKGVPIDGVAPTVDNVKNGSYPIFRPLNMLTNEACEVNELAMAFIDWILSEEGQAIVSEDYISVTGGGEEAPMAYTPPTDLTGQLQLAGSTTVQPLAEVLAEALMGYNPDLVIEVQGGGSSVGVTSAGECTVPIGNASRGIKESEMQQFPQLQVHTIAFDGIAVVNNPDLDIPTLSIEQVQSIFAGELTNWSEVGGPSADIVVVSREEGSGTRAAFEELVMGEEKLITENALLQQSNGQVRTTVSTTPNSVGYLSFGFLDESVKGVPIDGVAPTVDNVKNGSYPIFRPLIMLTNEACEVNELAMAFIEFILSPLGQEIVAEDYITVK